ncbi:hypothetical protein DJ568_12730 [Mucilaginibacter hurinus]|uniref:Thioredoxin domain-containing protein n=1 Tax=Mucilaginibacter hurinus TaxID=2201324 RepID=A0A367GNR2_9SPHI|nr:TlpA disulfide reductase family protein [Mucilaginibacter hurinus]RCH54678.1 hypothetical protein DJ568_12730 [Mucilaginibacter hurinus]
MKKSYKTFAVVLFVPFLLWFTTSTSKAQGYELRVGDKCPAELSLAIDQLLSKSAYKHNIGKPVLIDFWATWCSPCVAALPKLDSLQKKHSGTFTVLSVLERTDTRVREVLGRVFDNNGSVLTFIEREPILYKYFPHRTIPHYIWISKDKTIKVITADEMAISQNIQKLISEDSTAKIDTKLAKFPYDGDRPLFAGKQAAVGNELLYHSVITKRRSDLDGVMARGENFITCINLSMCWIFQTAFGKFDTEFADVNRLELHGFKTLADSANFGMIYTDTLRKVYRQNRQDNAYIYELMVPPNTHSFDALFEVMQQDINRYFSKTKGITGHLEKKRRKVLALQLIGKGMSSAFKKTDDRPGNYSGKSFLKMINQPMQFFLGQLTPFVQGKSLTLVNDTGYKDVVNIELSDTKDILSINKSLATYGLVLSETYMDIDVLVIQKK